MIKLNKYGDHCDAHETTKKGIRYDIPNGLDGEKYIRIIEEFVDMSKVKGLTVRQAQYVFEACIDYVLESKV